MEPTSTRILLDIVYGVISSTGILGGVQGIGLLSAHRAAKRLAIADDIAYAAGRAAIAEASRDGIDKTRLEDLAFGKIGPLAKSHGVTLSEPEWRTLILKGLGYFLEPDPEPAPPVPPPAEPQITASTPATSPPAPAPATTSSAA